MVYAFIVSFFLLAPFAFAGGAALHEGGVFDFEHGFVMHRPSLFEDRDWDEVGKGWGYWGRPALFQPPEHRYGHPSFNRNSFRPNVSSGTFSQEITMTSANGDALVWITFPVPQGHRLRCELDAITTRSEDDLQLKHGLAQGGAVELAGDSSDPEALQIMWQAWNVDATHSRFATESIEAVASSDRMTYYLWVRHEWATSTGATLCVDNLRVTDLGSAETE